MTAKTIQANDATVKVVEQSDATAHGKTVDADGAEYVWRYDGHSVEWLDEPDYYIRVKTETALGEQDLELTPDYDGPGLEGLTTGYDVDCRRCDYVGPMNIQKRKPDMGSETLEVCPECGLNDA